MSVVHCKKNKYDVYIGRPSKWGNPFVIGKDGNRDEVIRKYKEWIFCQPNLLKDLPELKDKVLGCWCYPQKCHGDVLVELSKICLTCNGGAWTFRQCLNCDDVYQYTGKYSSCVNEVKCEGKPSKSVSCPVCKGNKA